MSKPPLFPEQSTAGIAVDPRTLDRVIPESRRPDGSIRKERRVRPGFTPQEDVARFRGTRQQALDARALPKGQIIGWVAPQADKKEPASKAAKKNEKRKEKRKEKKQDAVRESWDSDEDGGAEAAKPAPAAGKDGADGSGDVPNWADAPDSLAGKVKATKSNATPADAVAAELEKLTVSS